MRQGVMLVFWMFLLGMVASLMVSGTALMLEHNGMAASMAWTALWCLLGSAACLVADIAFFNDGSS